MPLDGKYGQITTEHGTIGEQEPVFVLRAQDALSVPAMQAYRSLCETGGSPQRHLDAIDSAISAFQEWQSENPTKTPESAGFTASPAPADD